MYSTAISTPIGSANYRKERQLIKTVAASGTPERATAFSVSSITVAKSTEPGFRDIYTATVTTAAAHWIQTGDSVTISGANESQFNGDFQVASATPNTTTFTILLTTTSLASATGTIVGYARIPFTKAIVYGRKAARTANTGIVYLGPLATNDTQPTTVQSDGEYLLDVAVGARRDWSDVYIDVATNADGIVALFH